MSAPFQNKSAELLLKVAENLDVIIIMKEILFLQTTYKCHLTPSFLPLQLQVFDNRMTQNRCNRFKVKEQTHAGGSYHPCSCRGQTSAHSLCCSTAEPCWPRGLWCLLLHCTVCTRSLAFRYVPSHRPCLQVLMPRSGLQKFLQPGRKERSRRSRRLLEKWEIQRGVSVSLWDRPGWMKDKNSSSPPSYPHAPLSIYSCQNLSGGGGWHSSRWVLAVTNRPAAAQQQPQ